MSTERDFNEIITGLAKKRGFFWGPSPEIYGGSSGFYDLGPLGKLKTDSKKRFVLHLSDRTSGRSNVQL
ncbi:MAG: hypothetical protein ACW987_14765 [Candidatus Thorarchaeota archaeon]|jgi:glycyl-tRNA synthetase (class II)